MSKEEACELVNEVVGHGSVHEGSSLRTAPSLQRRHRALQEVPVRTAQTIQLRVDLQENRDERLKFIERVRDADSRSWHRE